MSTVQPPPPPAAPPVATTAVSLPVLTVSNPPPALLTLPIGTSLAALVTAATLKGSAAIETSLGTFLVATKLPLKSNQPLILQIGKNPGKGVVLLNVLEIAGKPILPGIQSPPAGIQRPGTSIFALADNTAASPAQTSQVNLLVGSTLNATTLTSISVLRVTPFSSTPAVPGLGVPQGGQTAQPFQQARATNPATALQAPQTTTNPATLASPSPQPTLNPAGATQSSGTNIPGLLPNDAPRVFPIGSQFSLTIQNLVPRSSATMNFVSSPVSNSAPTPSIPFSIDASATGRVIAHTLTGQPIVQTHHGSVALGTTQSIPVGTDITFKINTEPEVMDSTKPPLSPALQRVGMMSSGVWSSLDDSLTAIQSADPALAQQLQSAILPKADIKLAATTLFFLSALRGGDVRGWIGDNATRLLERLRPDIMRRLGNDFRIFSDIDTGAEARRSGDWRGTLIPFMNNQELEQIRLFTRYLGDEESDDGDKKRGIRFLIDITLTNIGRFQLDGIAETGEKRLDMIIRTASALPDRVRGDLMKLFMEANDMVGMRGGMIFQATPDSFVDPLAEAPHHDSSLGIIV